MFTDEMWPDNHNLLPKDPFQRAHVRIWSDYITKKVSILTLKSSTFDTNRTSGENFLPKLGFLSSKMIKDSPSPFGRLRHHLATTVKSMNKIRAL